MASFNKFAFLVDQMKLPVQTAREVIQMENSDSFIHYMKMAYEKGKQSVIDSYRTNDGK